MHFCRHGIKQLRNGWADGPAYITQCPIQTGSSYTYDFNVTGQRGTLWWHAHILWLRATVYGAIVVMPEQGTPFPFPMPYSEVNLLLGGFDFHPHCFLLRFGCLIVIEKRMLQFVYTGEWWNKDVEEVVRQGNNLGLPPNMSDAHTINGKPGPLFPCSEKRE